nr:MAG TPA: hypothetical protein [Caudoviricetes sp.]
MVIRSTILTKALESCIITISETMSERRCATCLLCSYMVGV